MVNRAGWLRFSGLVLAVVVLLAVSPVTAQGDSHVVQRGETLYRIALRYGVTVDSMVQANGLVNANQIYAGQVLVLPTASEPSAPTPQPQPTAPVFHIVQRGETLGTIAQRYGLTWQDIATANNIPNPNRILVGQQLRVPNASAPETPATVPAAVPAPVEDTAPPESSMPPDITPVPSAVPASRTHIVQPGETLSRIARRYGIGWPALAQANSILDPNRIVVGQQLSIPSGDSGPVTYLEPTTGQPAGPTPTITVGKQIIVDLSDQRIYAFEDGQQLRAVTVSTGLPGTPTVLGDYNIYWKLGSQTMSGPGYYLPGVPWVMYFYQGYAIHGTYWHSNFGTPMSHGCVNLPTEEAEWFFTWAEVGTPVRVIY